MSENAEKNPTIEVAETGATPNDAAEALGENGKKALQAERDARKAAEKATADLQAKLDQIQKAQMSDLERAQAEAKAASEAVTQAKAEALRWRIAAKFGISDEDAETFLNGSDEATLTRQAERLQSLAATPTSPKPDLSQGGKSGARPVSTAEKFAAVFEGRI